MKRRGLGKGLGMGYKNIVPIDSHIHSLSAKGKKTYKVFEDPAHAWMKVSLKELKELGIADKITGYSYKKGDYAYLEEDADLSLFADEMEKQKGIKVEFDIHSTNNSSKVRTFPRYTLNAKMFSMYGDKWKVLNKGKQNYYTELSKMEKRLEK